MTNDQANLSLHPGHLADLRKSGLLDETIREAGIYSVRPSDIIKKVGFNDTRIESVMAFPYLGCDGFEVYKIFPPRDGLKYVQPKGSPNRLYIPSLVKKILKNPSVPVCFTEGIKKALKACQEGIGCVAMSGLWNWSDGSEEKHLIPDFGLIEWKGRTVCLIPDNDFEQPDRHGERRNSREAVYQLAYRLIDRGAKPFIVELPQGSLKGLDDYLCQHSVDDFHSLPKRPIRKRSVEEMVEDPEEDYTEVLKRLCDHREGEKDILIKALCKRRGIRVDSVRADLKEMKPARGGIDVDRLLELEAGQKKQHSAQTIHEGKLAFGGVFGGQKVLIRSDGEIVAEDKDCPFKFSQPKLRAIDVKNFREGKSVSGKDILDRLERLFSSHVYFRDSRIPMLLAVWVMATYLFKLFRFFGYIILNSPVKGCGKSLVLDILSLACFNATLRLTMPSAAVIFRQVDGDDSTLIIDEAETLGGTDQEKADLIGLLNAGFQRGAMVPRMEGKGTDMRIRNFSAFSPKCLAGINKLASTLEDRAFRIVMEKKTAKEKVERFNLRKLDSEVDAIRGDLYVWALKNAETVMEIYDRVDEIPGLNGLGDRQRDIVEPLLSIALVIDGEGESVGIVETLKSLAFDMARSKDERDRAIEAIPAAISVIGNLMNGHTELFISNSALLEEMRKDDALGFLESTKALAGFMKKLEIYCKQRRTGEGVRRGYTFDREQVEDWGRRYLWIPPVPHTPI
jgi:hypothetical protein